MNWWREWGVNLSILLAALFLFGIIVWRVLIPIDHYLHPL